MKPTFIHDCDQSGLTFDHDVQKSERLVGGGGQLWIVACQGVTGDLAQLVVVAAGSEELERADPQMACCHTSQHSTGQSPVAQHLLTRGHRRQRSCRGDAEGKHRLAHQVLAKHRTERRPAVAAPRERRASGALEGDVVAIAERVDDLTQEQRSTVAELRVEATELVAGVGLCNRSGTGGHRVAGEDRGAQLTVERVSVQAERLGKLMVEAEQTGFGDLDGLPGCEEAVEFGRVRVVELEQIGRCRSGVAHG